MVVEFFFPVFLCFDGSHFFVFLQLFLAAPAGQNNITQVFCHFPRWPPFWKANAPSMFVQSRCFVLAMYQSKTDFTANETHFFSLPLRSLSNPSQPVMGSWRISPAQPSDQCCASEVYRRACNAFSSSNNLRDSTLLCDAEATTLGLSCHCAGELLAPRSDFPRQQRGECGGRNTPRSNRDHRNPANSS